MDRAAGFHPLLDQYFSSRFGEPTNIQKMVWPVAASGRHLLALAPTGSGKTLAAFFSFINDFVTDRLTPGTTRLLYVSPLRALNNDIRTNLLTPLEELHTVFENAGYVFPAIRVMTRSGDTPQSERRRMQLHPPEILITTPESLNLLLASGAGARMLSGLRAVIVDEIHALAPGLRGAHLLTAVERVEEFVETPLQRIGLSATVAVPERIARYLGGWDGDFRRPVELIYEGIPAVCELDIKLLWKEPVENEGNSDRENTDDPELPPETIWEVLADEIYQKICARRRILCFAESRRVVERVASMVNDLHRKNSETIGQDENGIQSEPVAFAHHGSLSREIRLAVEERFKAGKLFCVVATSSLELGIDIGELDEVLLLQTPSSVAAALQRLGRSGHRPGEISRGTLYPLHSMDLLNGVVLRGLIARRQLEPIHPPSAPLDLLAQLLISMACEAEAAGRNFDAEHGLVILRRSDAYHELDRRYFDLTLEMLQGRFQSLPFPALRPSLEAAHTETPSLLIPRSGARLQLYQSGGTIPERGLYKLRLAGSPDRESARTLIGELDEEFVWERRVGDRFVLGSRLWQVHAIGDSEVEVVPASSGWGMSPFWKADSRDRENGFADAISEALDHYDRSFDIPGFLESLARSEGEDVSRALQSLLLRQRQESGAALPGRYRIVVEALPGEDASFPVFLHTFWGGRRNRPFGLALSAALEERFSTHIPYFASDDGVLVVLPRLPESADLFLLSPESLSEYLERALPQSGLFGAQFRQAAATALLLPGRGFGRRRPLWQIRSAAGRLLDALSGKGEFPVTVEAYRSLLRDRFDIDGLKSRLEECQSGKIEFCLRYVDKPTPFAAGLDFQRINELTYEPDRVGGEGHRTGYFSELIGSRWIPIPADIIQLFEERSLRLDPAYAPESDDQLIEWLQERSFLPESEWNQLCETVGVNPGSLMARTERIDLAGSSETLICSMQARPVIMRSLDNAFDPDIPSPGDLLLRFMEWYGPVRRTRLEALFGSKFELMRTNCEDEPGLISGALIRGDDEACLCVRKNLERLYRLQRHRGRSTPPIRPLSLLPLLIAHCQGVYFPRRAETSDVQDLQRIIEKLFGAAAPVSIWETQILPVRQSDYRSSTLDALFTDSKLSYTGTKTESIFFFLDDEAPLFLRNQDLSDEDRSLIHGLPVTSEGIFPSEAVIRSGTSEVRGKLLDALHAGFISGRSVGMLRKLARSSFRGRHSEERATARNRWRTQVDYWCLPGRALDIDPLMAEEQNRMRVRLLLDRYGILFRELLQKELPAFRWSSLFRTLCRMELAGEVHAGIFFEGLSGLQFLSAEAWRWLQTADLADRGLWWINACDPASLSGCGLTIDPERPLPSRLPGNRMIYRGEELVAIETRHGKEVRFFEDPDQIHDLRKALLALLHTDFQPLVRLSLESINGIPALKSPYRSVLEQMGFRTDGKQLVCHREVGR